MSFVNRQYLVETDWLANHLDDPDLRIVDCTQYLPNYAEKVEITTVSGRENYAKGHIPGAAYVDLLGELTDRTSKGRLCSDAAGRAVRRRDVAYWRRRGDARHSLR